MAVNVNLAAALLFAILALEVANLLAELLR